MSRWLTLLSFTLVLASANAVFAQASFCPLYPVMVHSTYTTYYGVIEDGGECDWGYMDGPHDLDLAHECGEPEENCHNASSTGASAYKLAAHYWVMTADQVNHPTGHKITARRPTWSIRGAGRKHIANGNRHLLLKFKVTGDEVYSYAICFATKDAGNKLFAITKQNRHSQIPASGPFSPRPAVSKDGTAANNDRTSRTGYILDPQTTEDQNKYRDANFVQELKRTGSTKTLAYKIEYQDQIFYVLNTRP